MPIFADTRLPRRQGHIFKASDARASSVFGQSPEMTPLPLAPSIYIYVVGRESARDDDDN